MKRFPVPALSGIVLVVTCACTSPTVNLGDRVWSGTWQGTSPGSSQGTLTVTFPRGDAFGMISTFDVEMTVQGPACSSPDGAHGEGSQSAAELVPSVRFAVQIGTSVYQFEGSHSGTSMGGTYARTSGSCADCDCGLGEAGTWQVVS